VMLVMDEVVLEKIGSWRGWVPKVELIVLF
jgi:hypothetical protein